MPNSSSVSIRMRKLGANFVLRLKFVSLDAKWDSDLSAFLEQNLQLIGGSPEPTSNFVVLCS